MPGLKINKRNENVTGHMLIIRSSQSLTIQSFSATDRKCFVLTMDCEYYNNNNDDEDGADDYYHYSTNRRFNKSIINWMTIIPNSLNCLMTFDIDMQECPI